MHAEALSSMQARQHLIVSSTDAILHEMTLPQNLVWVHVDAS